MIFSPEQLLSNLGDAVRAGRKGRGWTRRELARRSALSERFLADVERGKANPSILRLAGIAEALGTTPEALLHRVPRPDGRRNVALLGLRGAGKSSVGAELARQLDCPFHELDSLVEASVGLSLAELFELHGEDFYRRAEREVLAELLAEKSTQVIATGGGIVTEPETFELLKQHSHTIWLKARPEDHWARVVAQGDTRPMGGNEGAFSHLCAILSEREKLYQQAEVTIETSNRSIEKISDELAAKLKAVADLQPPDRVIHGDR